MTMSPEDFHDLMVAATTPEPMQGSVDSDIAVGRRLLRRRRAVVGLGTAAAVVGLAGTAWAVAPGLGPSSSRVPVAHEAPPSSDAQLLDSCRAGNQSDRATRAVFGAGDPTVKAVSRTGHQVVAALESADGAHWAECWVRLDAGEFPAGMTVWGSAGRDADASYSFGTGCGLVDGELDPSCRTFSVTWVDRRPAVVAAAEFVTADGETTRVRSQDGYLVLNHLGKLPAGASSDPSEAGFSPIRTITFLDDSGEPIAAEAQDGSGSGPDGERVGDLPSIRSYPGLRSAQAIY